MLKYYISAQYRKLYCEIESFGTFKQTFDSFNFCCLRQYFESNNQKSERNEFVNILLDEKLTPVKCFKFIAIVHAYLQISNQSDVPQQVHKLLSQILTYCQQKILKKKKQSKGRPTISKSAVFSLEQAESFNKEIYLLQSIIKPYVAFVQKVTSVNQFYQSLKKSNTRQINEGQIWIIMNLFKYISVITNQIPVIMKMLRKSYKLVAKSLLDAFSRDVGRLYPKIYRFMHFESCRIQSQFFELENQFGEQQVFRSKSILGVDVLANLIEDVNQLNFDLKLVGKNFLMNEFWLNEPQYVDFSTNQFDFILQFDQAKKEKNYTPKFKKMLILDGKNISEHILKVEVTEKDDKEGPIKNLPQYFRNITNQDDSMTFRTKKCSSLNSPQHKKIIWGRNEIKQNQNA